MDMLKSTADHFYMLSSILDSSEGDMPSDVKSMLLCIQDNEHKCPPIEKIF